MQTYADFINALNDFIHTWMFAFKNIELEYVYFDNDDFNNCEYMYILWANGRQSRMNLSYSYPSFEVILQDFLNHKFEDVPYDEYI